LRVALRDPREQRRLARVREAGERRVGEQLQVQLDLDLLPGRADLGEARRLAGRRREARVPAPAGWSSRMPTYVAPCAQRGQMPPSESR